MTLIGFYGDDFTGSVDALLQYRRAGLDGVLVTSPQFAPAAATDQVVGIAGIARSLPTDRLADEVLPALTALARLGPRVVQYKACSTADSSPETGSLGRAIELGRQVYGNHPVGVLLAQPDFGRYTAFGNHFARDGETVYRLDRHPTMRQHPVTPSREADLARHLGGQTCLTVASLPFVDFLADGAEAEALLACDAEVVVLDGLTDEHLRWAGRAVLGQPQPTVFALGSGGLSRGVGLAVTGRGRELAGAVEPADGPVLVVSGSRSASTWAQVGDAVGRGWQPVDVLSERDAAAVAARAFATGRSLVAYSSAPGGPLEPDGVKVARRLVEVVEAVAAKGPITRLVVAGGDTCGRVLTLLGVQRIELLAAPWGNAAFCRIAAPHTAVDGIGVVLKGGQMGSVDLFERIRTGTPLASRLPRD